MNNDTIQFESKELPNVEAPGFQQIQWIPNILKKLCLAVTRVQKGGLKPRYELERNRILKDQHQNSLARLSIDDKQRLGLYPWIN